MGARSASTRGERRGDGPSSWRPPTDRTYHEVGIRCNAQDKMPLVEEEDLAIEFSKELTNQFSHITRESFSKDGIPFLRAQNKS